MDTLIIATNMEIWTTIRFDAHMVEALENSQPNQNSQSFKALVIALRSGFGGKIYQLRTIRPMKGRSTHAHTMMVALVTAQYIWSGYLAIESY